MQNLSWRDLSMLARFLTALVVVSITFAAAAQTREAPNVSGTTWSGTQPFGQKTDYYFAQNGRLIHRDGSGVWTNSTWRQQGDNIMIEMNNKFSVFRGTIKDGEISGEFSNVRGQKAPWSASRLPQNDEALVATSLARPVPDLPSREPLSRPSYPGQGFIGSFEGDVAWETSSLTIRLQCETTLRCEMESINVANSGKPAASKSLHEDVREATNLGQARLSLQYARRNRFDKATREDVVATIDKLKPLLESDTDIERCLDLSEGTGTYLVCKMVRSPWKEPAILYFGSNLESCRQRNGFCGKVIFPLFEKNPR